MEQKEYEKNLIEELRDQWAPARRMGMQARKTEPLSDECKEAILALGKETGMTVTFTVEPVQDKDGIVDQHYVNAVRPRTTPAI